MAHVQAPPPPTARRAERPSATAPPPPPTPQPAGHAWTMRWMDGSAVSCGIVFDAHRERWRVWIVCNRELSTGGPLFEDEDEAVAWANGLRRDWSLDNPVLEFRPLLHQIGDSLARLREKSVS